MSSVTEESKQSLPAGDPEGGNTPHDTSPVFQTGTLPEVEQDIYDEREQAREDRVKEIAESEDKIAKQRQADNEEREAKRLAETEKVETASGASKTSSTSATSTKSSSS